MNNDISIFQAVVSTTSTPQRQLHQCWMNPFFPFDARNDEKIIYGLA